jgi:hypothetical protein
MNTLGRRLFLLLVIVVVVIAGAGFYRGWFGLTTGGDEQHPNVQLTVNKDKVKEDEQRAAAAIGRAKDSVVSKPQEPAKPTAEKETKESAATDRQEYVKSVETKLHDLDTRITDLRTKADGLASEAKTRISAEIDALAKQRSDVSMKLENLKSASGKAWQGLKAEVDKGQEELQQAYEKLRAKLE